jgi:four helix bundle protein
MSQELEDRFFRFAEATRDFCRKLKWDIINVEYVKQLIRSSGSVGANYIEASDDLGKQDEKMKLKIARREAKESIYWLKLVLVYEAVELDNKRALLMDEATQIKKILSAILGKL